MRLQTPPPDSQCLRNTNPSERIAIMEETPRSPKSIRSHYKQADGTQADDVQDADRMASTVRVPGQSSNHLRLRVTLRQTRILLFTSNIVMCVVMIVVFFGYGYDWSRFDSRDLTDGEKNALLDRYNSLSGSAASAFSRPIEIFISMAVHVVVLRLMAALVLDSSQSGWRIQSATIILTVALGYLIGNAFNALNVQLRPLEVRPVLSAEDLALASSVNTSSLDAITTTLKSTISETTPRNSITNTVLRSLVLPSPPLEATWCDWLQAEDLTYGEMPATVVEYGFPQFDWQRRVLQRAIGPKSVRVVVNATTLKQNNMEQLVSEFPMQASLAADLFLMGVFFSRQHYRWGESIRGDLNYAVMPAYSPDPVPSASAYGLLPRNATAVGEEARRAWFLNKSQAVMSDELKSAANTSRADFQLEFNHVDITPSIEFDAVTFEAEVDPALLTSFLGPGNQTRYLTLKKYLSCGPWLGRCVLPKPLYRLKPTTSYDSAPQVSVFAMPSRLESKNDSLGYLNPPFEDDPPIDSSSLLVVSLAKRQAADEVLYNVSENATGIKEDSGDVYVVNARKFYSLTIGRLHWRLQNLSDVYGAACAMSPSPQACLGLAIPLSPPLASSPNDSVPTTKETLVVGAGSLPHQQLMSTKGLHHMLPRSAPLVRIHEPPRISVPSEAYDAIAGDPLLPTNVKRFAWNSIEPVVAPRYCNGRMEDRYRTILNRHLYMEHSLQTAYTSAVFFLFQNGVVKDGITLSTGAESLKFDQNKQDIAVHLSIPWVNVTLTLIGCTALVVGLGGVALLSRFMTSTSMDAIHTPEAIARVLKDEVQFPPSLLHRDVVHMDDELPSEDVERFTIESLTLSRQNAHGKELWVAHAGASMAKS